MNYSSYVQNKKLPPDVETDTGEVSDDEEAEMEEIIEIMTNGDHKLERQNSRHGSLKRQIVKVSWKHFGVSLRYNQGDNIRVVYEWNDIWNESYIELRRWNQVNFSCTDLKSPIWVDPNSKVHRVDSNVEFNLSNLSLITMYNACFRERRELWDAKINYTNACILFGTWEVRHLNRSRSTVDFPT